jgi:hypothetical protein
MSTKNPFENQLFSDPQRPTYTQKEIIAALDILKHIVNPLVDCGSCQISPYTSFLGN